MNKVSLRERVASVQHEIWTHWMRYFFSQCGITDEGDYFVPKSKFERWIGLMAKPYAELSEQEKESDREQADKVLAVLEPAMTVGTELLAACKALTEPRRAGMSFYQSGTQTADVDAYWFCVYCDATSRYVGSFEHRATCLISVARAAIDSAERIG